MAETTPLVIDRPTADSRLAAMKKNGFGAGLPRKRVDRYVLLNALAQLVAEDESPGEREVTARLKAWLASEGARLSTDAVTLRRALVDEGFLDRDGRGTAYHRSRRFERTVVFPAGDSLAAPPGWAIETVDGMPQLVRVFRRKDFAAALALAQKVGAAADAADHHPSLLVEWGKLTVRWWTHDLGGIGPKDVTMAGRTDRLAEEA